MADSHQVWIQNADYSSSVDQPAQSADHVLNLFDTFNWAQQLDLETKKLSSGEDCCPPGLGIVQAPSGDILHLCPQRDGRVTIHYNGSAPSRMLGIIPSDKSFYRSFENIPHTTAREAIRRFMHLDNAWLATNFSEDKAL